MRSPRSSIPISAPLPLEDVEIAQGVLDAAQEKAEAALKAPRSNKPPAKRNRGHLPKHLPRIEQVIEPETTFCPVLRTCGEMTRIGEDGEARARHRFERRAERTAGRDPGAVPGSGDAAAEIRLPPLFGCGRAGTCTGACCAGRAADRGADRPCDRQQVRRSPAILPAGGDLRPSGRHARPRQSRQLGRTRVFASPARRRCGRVSPEDATAPVLDPGRKRTKTGYFLQCDGYGGYDRLTAVEREQGPWTLVHCWSHLRRRFVKIMRGTASPIAEEALRQIGTLYAVEKTVRGLTPEIRLAARREHSAPIVAAFKPWFEKQLSTISSGSKLAEHIRYALGHWEGLTRFLDDGRLELDTNPVENAIRPIALTRKTRSSQVTRSARKTGRSSPRSSQPASSTASIQPPTSRTRSPRSSTAIRKTGSTSRCLGPQGQRQETPHRGSAKRLRTKRPRIRHSILHRLCK